jgi:16S rRNA (uracil1498-N3)-methyltransferase
MSRFFVNKEININDIIIITGDDAKHIAKVLRHKPGDFLRLSDGKQTEGIAQIEEIDYRNIQIKTKIVDKNKMEEIYPKITLFQALLKGDKIELIIQKATEIGVSAIVPMSTERTIVDLSKHKLESKWRRWQKIALEAAKQCMRMDIPRIDKPQDFDTCISQTNEFQLVLIPWELESTINIKQILKENKNDIKNVAIFIGPEGGFSPEEINSAKENRAISVSLGQRILRSETAAITACSILMYELGDLG